MDSQPGLTELGYTEGDMVQPGLYKVRLRGSLGYVDEVAEQPGLCGGRSGQPGLVQTNTWESLSYMEEVKDPGL